jgi:uncharacterized membrane protein
MATSDMGKYMVYALYFLFNLLVISGNSDVNATYLGNMASVSTGPEYSIDSLFIALLRNGDASIDYNLVINSNKPTANITLFGQTVQNLSLTDYNGTALRYQVTEWPEKIVVYTRPSSNIHVTYITPDFVDKQNRNWTFSFSFNDKFLLKMPADARIISMQPQPYLTPTYEQDLWGFGPGNVKLQYVIGPLGTREEAQASILLIEDTIEETKTNYKDIVMTNVTALVEQAKSLFEEGKYLEAVTYSARADVLIENITGSYAVGQQTISQAESSIKNKKDAAYDTSEAEKQLVKAKSLFSQGFYDNATSIAKFATSQPIRNDSSTIILNLGITLSIIIAIMAILFLILRRRTRILGSNIKNNFTKKDAYKEENGSIVHDAEKRSSQETNSKRNKSGTLSSMPVNILPGSYPDQSEIKDYLNQVVEEVNNAKIHACEDKENRSRIPSSSPSFAPIEKEEMAQTVARMKMKKPYLRLEDKELLDFLVEKNGSAFESELRMKFVLPRTSLWRLVKRLEREDLLIVRKIGGQNMISLKIK